MTTTAKPTAMLLPEPACNTLADTLHARADAAFAAGDRAYSNWELSADRANASRRDMLAGGLPEEQVLRVQGLAASNPFDRKDPTAPANRRISVVVMTREAEDRVFRATPSPLEALPPEPEPAASASSPVPRLR